MLFQNWILENGESLQYVFYFGLLLLLGAGEVFKPLALDKNERKRRWGTNFALTFINIIALGALPVTGFTLANYAETRGLGLLNLYEQPWELTLLAVFLIRSFISWFNHLLTHKIPFLWRIHRVHHLDNRLDISTTVRFHPLEFIVNLLVIAPFIFAFGLPVWALMAYEVLDVIINVFSHSNVRIPDFLERTLRWIIVTPGVHRVHHSSFQPETDSNYGAVLTLWDRLFGTLVEQTHEPLETLKLGLEKPRDARVDRLTFLLAVPFLKQRQFSGSGKDQNQGSELSERKNLDKAPLLKV